MGGAVYLLLGPENGQKDDFIAAIRKSISAQGQEDPEEYRYYPFDASIADIVAVLRNSGLFSKQRFVILNQAHDVKKGADIELLKSYCKKPVDDATLIMVSDRYSIDKRLKDAVPGKNTKVFFELFENKKRSWIIDFFRKEGKQIEIDAVNLLLELVENDTRDFRRECQRLALVATSSSTITEDMVDELVYHSKEESVFTLFDYIAAGDFPGSLETLQSLRLSGKSEPSAVLGGLAYQFRRLLAVKEYMRNRLSPDEALKKARIRGKKNGRTYIEASNIYSTTEIEKILALIADYEEDFRSGLTDLQDTGLQLFLYDTVVKKGRSGTPFNKAKSG